MTFRPPVLDTHALITYLDDESGARVVESAIDLAIEQGYTLPMSVINWGEVLYITERKHGLGKTAVIIAGIDELPISIIDADRKLTLSAARIKAAGGISYADAHCCALALALGAPIMTGDPEFASVEGVEVVWLPDP